MPILARTSQVTVASHGNRCDYASESGVRRGELLDVGCFASGAAVLWGRIGRSEVLDDLCSRRKSRGGDRGRATLSALPRPWRAGQLPVPCAEGTDS